MQRKIRNTTFLLLVFVMPMTFQNLHVLDHFKSRNSSNHLSGITVAEDGAGYCPLCKYQFTACDLIEINLGFDFISFKASPLKEIPLNLFICFSGNNISLRAPPSFIAFL